MKTALNLLCLKTLESDGSLACPKEPTAGLYPEPGESRPHPNKLLSENTF